MRGRATGVPDVTIRCEAGSGRCSLTQPHSSFVLTDPARAGSYGDQQAFQADKLHVAGLAQRPKTLTCPHEGFQKQPCRCSEQVRGQLAFSPEVTDTLGSCGEGGALVPEDSLP